MSIGSAALALSRFARPSACDLQAMSDAELLERFFQSREDSAFAVLVRRHGPQVYSICRRVLRDANDAEDAFQATFLVLVRKGRTLSDPSRLGNWLYGVAYRTARKARARAIQRSQVEKKASPALSTVELGGMTYQELSDLLDEEISQLPEKYASPLVLCYLEGKTNAQAASQLGWPEGSVSRRLARGRELLRARLKRRGLTLSVMLMACVFSRRARAHLSPPLVESTARAAGLVAQGIAIEEVVAPATAELVREVVQGMPSASRLALSALLAVAAVALAVTVMARQWGVPAYGSESARNGGVQAADAAASCGAGAAPAGAVDAAVQAAPAPP